MNVVKKELKQLAYTLAYGGDAKTIKITNLNLQLIQYCIQQLQEYKKNMVRK